MIRPVLAMLLGLACQLPTEPIGGAEPIGSVPVEWRAAYEWTWEHCARALRPVPAYRFRVLVFYRVPGKTFPWRGAPVRGLWSGRDIYLSDAALADTTHRTLRHEFLHAQLGVSNHPPPFTACRLMA
jgi:hypothetical protein